MKNHTYAVTINPIMTDRTYYEKDLEAVAQDIQSYSGGLWTLKKYEISPIHNILHLHGIFEAPKRVNSLLINQFNPGFQIIMRKYKDKNWDSYCMKSGLTNEEVLSNHFQMTLHRLI